jgi:hypothetical protein
LGSDNFVLAETVAGIHYGDRGVDQVRLCGRLPGRRSKPRVTWGYDLAPPGARGTDSGVTIWLEFARETDAALRLRRARRVAREQDDLPADARLRLVLAVSAVRCLRRPRNHRRPGELSEWETTRSWRRYRGFRPRGGPATAMGPFR